MGHPNPLGPYSSEGIWEDSVRLVHSFKPSLRLLSVRRKAKRVVGKIWRLPKQARNEGGLDQTRLVVEMRYGWQ